MMDGIFDTITSAVSSGIHDVHEAWDAGQSPAAADSPGWLQAAAAAIPDYLHPASGTPGAAYGDPAGWYPGRPAPGTQPLAAQPAIGSRLFVIVGWLLLGYLFLSRRR